MAEFSLAPRLPSAWVRISQRSDTELLIICSKSVAVVPASNWRRSGEHMFKIDGLVKCCVILMCTLSRWVFLPGWDKCPLPTQAEQGIVTFMSRVEAFAS